MLQGRDVLAVLLTGYGKNLIFHLFAAAATIKMKRQQIVLIVCPLRSIIKDQIEEGKRMGKSGASVAELTESALRSSSSSSS